MNLDDYIISVVQIPPGYSSKMLLDTSNPQVEKFLRKFMKRLVKKPDSLFSRVLPTLNDQGDPLSLCVTDCQTPYIPYVVKASDSSWHIRQFPTHRLSVRSIKDNDCVVLDHNKEEPSGKSLKRAHPPRDHSPQLVISSDEEDGPPSKTRRIESQ
ncbi:unnamed protein product [Schistosoma turkestanicum]|nr:unnamed protein product [Schistosoma turkestanicum]